MAVDPAPPVQYVQPGQVAVSAEPRCLSTILGSCVAVCLWDREARTGGLNHYLLPVAPTGASPSLRFGDLAVPELIRQLGRLGSPPSRLVAWVFGGAHVIEGFPHRADHLGAQNVEIARDLLGRAGIPVVGGDVGGRRGRRVMFNTEDGRTLVRLL